jgi:hypothetical protein
LFTPQGRTCVVAWQERVHIALLLTLQVATRVSSTPSPHFLVARSG